MNRKDLKEVNDRGLLYRYKLFNDLGYGFKAGNGEVKKIRNNLTNVKVVLNPDGKGGYYIVTMYPFK